MRICVSKLFIEYFPMMPVFPVGECAVFLRTETDSSSVQLWPDVAQPFALFSDEKWHL